MSDKFSRLEEISARLNETSDSLNKAIARVEAKLASLKLGVTAWVKEPLEVEAVTDDQGETEHVITRRFGYTKTQGTWHLVMLEESDRYDKDSCGLQCPWPEISPLPQVTRELRIKAFLQLPALITDLERRAGAALKEVEKALVIADSV